MKPTRVLAGFASVSLLVFSLVALLPDYAYACSCGGGGPESPQERAERLLEESPAVFSGEVQDIEGDMENEGFQTVTLRTIDVWKGPHRDTLTVENSGGMCAYTFEEGREYLVNTDPGFGKQDLGLSPCSDTRLLSESSEDVQALSLVDTSGGVPDLRVIGLAGLTGTIAGLLLLRLLLRRSLNI
jgi:hypothetical protein